MNYRLPGLLFQNNSEVGVPFLAFPNSTTVSFWDNAFTRVGDTCPHRTLSCPPAFFGNNQPDIGRLAYFNHRDNNADILMQKSGVGNK